MRPILLALLLAIVAGCGAPETKPPENPKPLPAPAPKSQEPLACPAAPKPQCPAPTPAPAPAPEIRGKLDPADWSELPDWGRETLRPSLDAFARDCSVLAERDEWKAACEAALAVPVAASESDLAQFFRAWFVPYRVVNADDTPTGMITGYYEPLLHGSRTRTRRYRFPIVADADFGHTSPQCTLPIGCRAEIDSARRRLAVVEAAVEERPAPHPA